ncbi:uncharacterized protein LJ206_017641 isoform 1-T1 [Theristicus caerulescens]
MAKGAGVETVRSCPDLCKTVTISHVLPALIRPLMSQAPLIADFTRFRPIVDLHRRGFDSSGQAPGRGGAGGSRREGGREEGKKKGGGGEEGVGSIGSKKTCQQNKILTNDREKCSKSHPRLLSAYRVSPGCAAAGERPPPVRGQRGATSAERGAARSRGAGGRRQRAPAGLGGGGGPGGWSGRGSSAAAVLRQILESGSRWGAPRPPLRAPPRKAAQRRRGGRRRAAGGGPAARPRVATSSAAKPEPFIAPGRHRPTPRAALPQTPRSPLRGETRGPGPSEPGGSRVPAIQGRLFSGLGPGAPGRAPPHRCNTANALACRIKPIQSSLVSPALCSCARRWDCRGWGANGDRGTRCLGRPRRGPRPDGRGPDPGACAHGRGGPLMPAAGRNPASPPSVTAHWAGRDEPAAPARGLSSRPEASPGVQRCPRSVPFPGRASPPAPGRCSAAGHRARLPGASLAACGPGAPLSSGPRAGTAAAEPPRGSVPGQAGGTGPARPPPRPTRSAARPPSLFPFHLCPSPLIIPFLFLAGRLRPWRQAV